MRSSMLIAGTLAILTSASTQPAHADIRSDFKDGCASGHGSYVENVDNVQCKTSGSLTITCDKAITHCNASNVVCSRARPLFRINWGSFRKDIRYSLPAS